MKRYLRLLRMFISQTTSASLMYRGSFWSSMTADLAWGVFYLLSILFITNKISSINGWSRYELLFLSSSANITVGLISLIAKNFYTFSDVINQGRLYGILLNPVDSQFMLSFKYINIAKLPRIIFSFILNIYLLHMLHVQVTLINLIGYIVLLLIGFIFIYCMWFIASTLLIWFTRLSNLSELLFQFTEITRYPREVYTEFSQYLFFFLLPLTLVVVTPSKVLLQKTLGGEVWFLLG